MHFVRFDDPLFLDPTLWQKLMSAKPTRVLVNAPHRDDEVLGFAAAILKHKAAGHIVAVAHYFTRDGAMLDEAVKALEILGVDYMFQVDDGSSETSLGALLRSGGIDVEPAGQCRPNDPAARALELSPSTPTLEYAVNVYRAFRPHFVYAPHMQDDDPSHKVVASVVRSAHSYGDSASYFRTSFEAFGAPPRPAVFVEGEIWSHMSRPSTVIPVSSAEADVALSAITAYRSQLNDAPFDDGLVGNYLYRGAFNRGQGMAAAFNVAYDQSGSFFRWARNHHQRVLVLSDHSIAHSDDFRNFGRRLDWHRRWGHVVEFRDLNKVVIEDPEFFGFEPTETWHEARLGSRRHRAAMSGWDSSASSLSHGWRQATAVVQEFKPTLLYYLDPDSVAGWHDINIPPSSDMLAELKNNLWIAQGPWARTGLAALKQPINVVAAFFPDAINRRSPETWTSANIFDSCGRIRAEKWPFAGIPGLADGLSELPQPASGLSL